ncbi:hypothetical protein CTK_C28030 [Clostridium tyrobutyricum]|nr:hypothetical protein CTK_C28030 [Clostridium tyrobutyricum]
MRVTIIFDTYTFMIKVFINNFIKNIVINSETIFTIIN